MLAPQRGLIEIGQNTSPRTQLNLNTKPFCCSRQSLSHRRAGLRGGNPDSWNCQTSTASPASRGIAYQIRNLQGGTRTHRNRNLPVSLDVDSRLSFATRIAAYIHSLDEKRKISA